jgi:flagellar hook-length control protein FliK
MGISTNNRVGSETSFNSSSSNASVAKTKSDENTRDTFQSIMGLVNVNKNQSSYISNSGTGSSSQNNSKSTSNSTSNSASKSTSQSAYKKETQQYKTDNKVKSVADTDSGSVKKNDSAAQKSGTTEGTVDKATRAENNADNSVKKTDKRNDYETPADSAVDSGDVEPEELDLTDSAYVSGMSNIDALLAGINCDANGEISDADVTDFSELTDSIVQSIAEILGATTEQVEQSMQKLEIDVDGLLDENNVKELVLDIENASNIDMLVDESLGRHMSEISEAVSELVQEYQTGQPEGTDGYNADEQSGLNGKPGGVTELKVQPDRSNTTGDKDAAVKADDKVSDAYEDIHLDRNAKSETYKNSRSSEDGAVRNTDTATVSTAAAEKTVKTENSETVTKNYTDTRNYSSASDASETVELNQTGGESGFQNQNQQGSDSLDSSLIGNLAQALTDAVSQDGEISDFDGDVQAADIVRQVVDEIKANVNDKLRSLEVRLNPENLGRVQITVTTKNGVMQASIIAENEAAKNAIEGSLNILKEAFNEQNLKVDAVEVTIANYDFFKEDNQAENKENNQKNTSSGGNKDAGNDDIVNEDISDAEQLEQDMMQQSGNSVSYAI